MNAKIIKELEKNPIYLKTIYNLSKELDDTLAHDLRVELSSNEATPVEILENLIKDDDKQIRLNVLKLDTTSDKIVACALKDNDSDVRIAVIKQKTTLISEDDLWNCTKDKCDEVVILARKALKSRL